MLGQLDSLYKQYGVFRRSLIRLLEDAPAPSTFAKRFEGLDSAFQQMFNDERDRVRQEVHERICLQVPEVLKHTDFLVLDKKLTLSIQPAMPIPYGYTSYWPVRRDARRVIDLTLGVLLSDPKDCNILGYVALPRWTTSNKMFRFSCTSSLTELFGRRDLGFLQRLIQCNGGN